MARKKVELEPGRSLINRKKLTEKQMVTIKAIIAYFKKNKPQSGNPLLLSRTELREGASATAAEVHGKGAKRVASPYFISKNKAAKVDPKKAGGRGIYNLGVFLNFSKKPARSVGLKEKAAA